MREKFESFLERCAKAAVPAGESGLETSLQSIAIELTLATAAPPAGRGPEPGCRATCAVASAEVGATACESNNAWGICQALTIPTQWRSEGWGDGLVSKFGPKSHGLNFKASIFPSHLETKPGRRQMNLMDLMDPFHFSPRHWSDDMPPTPPHQWHLQLLAQKLQPFLQSVHALTHLQTSHL